MKKDDRVRHSAAPQWGLGRVLEDPAAGKVRIFFSDAGIKTISTDANIVVMTGKQALISFLDNLKIPNQEGHSSYKTLTVLKEHFLNQFPGGT